MGNLLLLLMNRKRDYESMPPEHLSDEGLLEYLTGWSSCLYTSMEQVSHHTDTNGGWANLVYAVDESGAANIQQNPFVPIPMYICRMCGWLS